MSNEKTFTYAEIEKVISKRKFRLNELKRDLKSIENKDIITETIFELDRVKNDLLLLTLNCNNK